MLFGTFIGQDKTKPKNLLRAYRIEIIIYL